MSQMFGKKLKFIWSDDAGATAIELGVLVSLVALVAIVSFELTGKTLACQFTNIGIEVAGGTPKLEECVVDTPPVPPTGGD